MGTGLMMCRGVRGAITVDKDDADEIISATTELLQKIIETNGIVEDDVASVIFTTTPDLRSAYPAQAARRLGWQRVALMGCQEIDVPNGMPLAIRILIHWNTVKSLDEITHVYMRDAVALRPDLYPTNKIVLNGQHEHGGSEA